MQSILTRPLAQLETDVSCSRWSRCASFFWMMIKSKMEQDRLWESVSFQGTPQEIQERRQDAETRHHHKVEEARKSKAREKREEESRLVQKQIEVERATRERVEARKNAEKLEAQVRRQGICTDAHIRLHWISGPKKPKIQRRRPIPQPNHQQQREQILLFSQKPREIQAMMMISTWKRFAPK